MFEKIKEDASMQKKPEKKEIHIFDNPLINVDLLRKNLYSLDTMSDNEIYDIVKTSYGSIFQDMINTKNSSDYLVAFTNCKFLNSLINVMRGINRISFNERICCNKIVYDYFTSDNNDEQVKKLLFTLSRTTNKDIIPSLLGIGLSEDLASRIALSRYSSLKEDINVKRVNFIIATSDKNLMDEQMIVNILCTLFSNVTPIFTGTMFDRYEEEDWMNEDVMEIYSTISLAVLDILNQLPSDKIRKVLISYTGDFELLKARDRNCYRFSMRSLSDDYFRINSIVKSLEFESVMVP